MLHFLGISPLRKVTGKPIMVVLRPLSTTPPIKEKKVRYEIERGIGWDEKMRLQPDNAKKILDKLKADSEKSISGFVHFLKWKGRMGNVLPRKDLIHVLDNAKSAKLVERIVNLYEEKGIDFDEEICELFIKKLIEINGTKVAGDMIADYNKRIGAWVTPTALRDLFLALEENRRVDIMINIADTVYKKKIPAAKSLEVVETLVRASSRSNDNKEHYLRAFALAEIMLSQPEEIARMRSQYPEPEDEPSEIDDSESTEVEAMDGESEKS